MKHGPVLSREVLQLSGFAKDQDAPKLAADDEAKR